MKREQVIQILTETKDDVKVKYKANVKGIFGSYARGEASEKSDVDILVDFEDGADLFDLVGLNLFLEEKLNCPVDVVPQNTLRKEMKSSVGKEIIYL